MRSAPCDLSMSAARADALFASTLQRSDEPSAVQVKQAIAAATRAFGDLGCAARVAQEYGEHPETAARRMRWARTAVAGVFRFAVRSGIRRQERPDLRGMPGPARPARHGRAAAGPYPAAGLLAPAGASWPADGDLRGVGQPQLAPDPLVERGVAEADDVGGTGARL